MPGHIYLAFNSSQCALSCVCVCVHMCVCARAICMQRCQLAAGSTLNDCASSALRLRREHGSGSCFGSCSSFSSGLGSRQGQLLSVVLTLLKSCPSPAPPSPSPAGNDLNDLGDLCLHFSSTGTNGNPLRYLIVAFSSAFIAFRCHN